MASLLAHGGATVILPVQDAITPKGRPELRLFLVETKPTAATIPETVAPAVPKQTAKRKVVPAPKPIATIRKPFKTKVSPQSVSPKAVQGLSSTSGAPTAEKGERGRPQGQPKVLAVDLTADAVLIVSSIRIPEYTPSALDANLEGHVMVDVFVDKEGKVVEAELHRTVGYGMDDRILEAAYDARFHPRKNRHGGPEDSWTEIRFNLRIP